MGKFRIEVTKEALKHIRNHFKSGNRLTIQTLEKIFIELEETPYAGIGKPEPLKYQYNGFWSRQINKKDRVVYRVDEEIVTVFVVAAIGHYFDK